jgi:hypothetical protein
MEVDKEVSAHEQLHLRPVTCVDLSLDGELIVTGLSPFLPLAPSVSDTHTNQEALTAQFDSGDSPNMKIGDLFFIK